MAIFSIILILIISVYIGYTAGNYYRKRYRFFCNINKLNNSNIINLMGQKNTVKYTIDEFKKKCTCKILSSCLDEFLLSITNKKYFIFKCKDLSNDEIAIIEQYFSLVGKNEASAEMQSLHNYFKIFSELEKETKEKMDKYSSMFLKLGFLVGCLIIILII